MKKQTYKEHDKTKGVIRYSDEISAGYFNGYNNTTLSKKDADAVEKNISFNCRNFRNNNAGVFLDLRTFPMNCTDNSVSGMKSPCTGTKIIMIGARALVQKIRKAPGLRYSPAALSSLFKSFSSTAFFITCIFLYDGHKSCFGSCDPESRSLIFMLWSFMSALLIRFSLWYRSMEELLSHMYNGTLRTAVLQSGITADRSRVLVLVLRRTLGVREFPVYGGRIPVEHGE